MTQKHAFKGWSQSDVTTWKNQQKNQRSYSDNLGNQIESLDGTFNVQQYGELHYDKKYPLYLIQTKSFDPNKPNILITGGVHGYETSGAHGALAFMQNEAPALEKNFNFVCAPCVSPWGYETINRWNPDALDPNRNFFRDSPAKECALLYQAITNLQIHFLAHFDLHETTDTDNTVFRPALEQRDASPQEVWDIPDGFYLVSDTSRPQNDFQKVIIQSVEKVTHIAPADKEGKIIGKTLISKGVMAYDVNKLHLCTSLTDAKYVTTTEVYPDSPKATPAQCIQAQIAAVTGGVMYLKSML